MQTRFISFWKAGRGPYTFSSGAVINSWVVMISSFAAMKKPLLSQNPMFHLVTILQWPVCHVRSE